MRRQVHMVYRGRVNRRARRRLYAGVYFSRLTVARARCVFCRGATVDGYCGSCRINWILPDDKKAGPIGMVNPGHVEVLTP